MSIKASSFNFNQLEPYKCNVPCVEKIIHKEKNVSTVKGSTFTCKNVEKSHAIILIQLDLNSWISKSLFGYL